MIFHISVMLLPWRYDGNSKKEKRKTLDKIIDDFFHASMPSMHTHHFINILHIFFFYQPTSYATRISYYSTPRIDL